jgi:uncharacterized protein YegP (UPF0339 family)
MHFSIWGSKDGQFYWELVGRNGETIAVSEMYTRKESAENTIASVRAAAGSASAVDHTMNGKRYDRRLP